MPTPVETRRSEEVDSGFAGPLRASRELAWHRPIATRRLHLTTLGMAVAAHAGLLYGLLHEPADELAGGGGQLEAISVTLVSSTALESRDVAPLSLTAAAEAIDVMEGATENASALPQMKQEKEEQDNQKTAEQSEAVAAIVEKPKQATASQDTKENLKEAATTSAIGGVTVRGDAPSSVKQSAPAAASSGAMREYARYVAQALAKARPRGIGGNGTVKIRFVLSPEGRLAAAEVLTSSGNTKLDAMALDAVRRTVFPVPPSGMTVAQLTYEIPYRFR